MNRFLLLLAAIFISSLATAQNIGIGTNAPNAQLHTTGTVRFQNYSGQGTRFLMVDSLGRLVTNTTTAASLRFSDSSSDFIPPYNCANNIGNYRSNITVSGLPASIPTGKIKVTVNITHTATGNLLVLLVAPNGQAIFLANHRGGTGDNFTQTVFSDEAATNITSGAAPFTGTFKPQGNVPYTLCGNPNAGDSTMFVTSFSKTNNGSINPNGQWGLAVFDDVTGDIGLVANWNISFPDAASVTTDNIVAKSANITQSTQLGGILNYMPSDSAYKPRAGSVLTALDTTGKAVWKENIFATSHFRALRLVGSGSSLNPIYFDEILYDVDGQTTSNYSTSDGWYTVPEDGFYNFESTVDFDVTNNPSGSTIDLKLIGGYTLELSSITIPAGNRTVYLKVSAQAVKLTKGTTVYPYGYASGATITPKQYSGSFQGYRIY